ncbi:MAG: RidA family protein [Bacilli bacterium]|jgi:2-iminobutanoate/2-iminopropanoate deaminase|nr:RidA family protein [Bacilli bacterium]
MKKIIATNQAPKAVGPYSQGILINQTLYVSGQIPYNPQTNALISASIEDQTQQALENILAIVKEAGMKKEDIVRCGVFMTNLSDFAKMNQVYEAFFGSHKPVRAAVEVKRLPKDVQIEIDAIAVIEK